MLRTLPYRYYKQAIFPHVNHLRGTTRLLSVLAKIARIGIEKIDERDVKTIFEYEWDNLVILDACRHDLYERLNGSTDSRISIGSGTTKYINRTYSEGDYSDVVYIAGNPYFSKEGFRDFTGRDVDEVFHEVFHTYDTDWDDDEGTIRPEPLIRDALTARKLFPEKKIVVHFMQPHIPFIGSDLSLRDPESDMNPWGMAETGLIDRETIKEAYRENLEFVMPFVEELVEGLDGKTVITSDHGNMVGENGLYGHPAQAKVKPLRKVPWDVRD